MVTGRGHLVTCTSHRAKLQNSSKRRETEEGKSFRQSHGPRTLEGALQQEGKGGEAEWQSSKQIFPETRGPRRIHRTQKKDKAHEKEKKRERPTGRELNRTHPVFALERKPLVKE